MLAVRWLSWTEAGSRFGVQCVMEVTRSAGRAWLAFRLRKSVERVFAPGGDRAAPACTSLAMPEHAVKRAVAGLGQPLTAAASSGQSQKHRSKAAWTINHGLCRSSCLTC